MATKKSNTVPITFRTLKMQATEPNEWPAAAQYDLEQGRVMSALVLILGKESFDAFLALEPAPTLKEAGQLLEQVASVVGADLGKSDAPSDTESSTAAS